MNGYRVTVVVDVIATSLRAQSWCIAYKRSIYSTYFTCIIARQFLHVRRA